MLSWVIQITVISIILIFLVHHLINFFKSTLTVPKIKDLVNNPAEQYQKMNNIIKNNSDTFTNTFNNNLKDTNDYTSTNDYTLIDLLPKAEESTMKSKLKNFLKKQLHGSSNNLENNISTLDSGSSSYSNW